MKSFALNTNRLSKYYIVAVLLLTLANPQGIFGQSLEMDGLYDYVNNNTVSTSGFKNILKTRNSLGNINPRLSTSRDSEWSESFDIDANLDADSMLTSDYTWSWWGSGFADVSNGNLNLAGNTIPDLLGAYSSAVQIDEFTDPDIEIHPANALIVTRLKFSTNADSSNGYDALVTLVAMDPDYSANQNLYYTAVTPEGIVTADNLGTPSLVTGTTLAFGYDQYFWQVIAMDGDTVSVWVLPDTAEVIPDEPNLMFTINLVTDVVEPLEALVFYARTNPGDSSVVHIDEVYYGTLDDLNDNATVTAQFEEVRSEVNESDTAFSINVVLSSTNLTDVFLSYTVSILSTADHGSDFISTDSTIFIPAGDTISEIVVQIVDDDIYETPEEIYFMLGSNDSTIVVDNPHHFLIITDDDYPTGWDLNPNEYEHFMIVTGIIGLIDTIPEDNLMHNLSQPFLGAFIGEECRGLVTPVEYDGNQIFPLMIRGHSEDQGSIITFRYFSEYTQSVYPLANLMEYHSSEIVGSHNEPVVFSTLYLQNFDADAMPDKYIFHPAYPNPFNPVTTISYDIPKNGLVIVTIHDLLGRKVRSLVNSTQTAGQKSTSWDGKDDMGNKVAGGMYLCQIHAGNFIQTKKLMLLK